MGSHVGAGLVSEPALGQNWRIPRDWEPGSETGCPLQSAANDDPGACHLEDVARDPKCESDDDENGEE